jgi:hypothetical protein
LQQALYIDREVDVELKWILAVVCEVAFWTLFLTFLLLRYRYGRDELSVAVFIAIVADHVAMLGLGVWDYVQTGHVNLFTAFVVAILVYGLTIGRRQTQRLDAWARARFRPRSRTRPEARSAPLRPR